MLHWINNIFLVTSWLTVHLCHPLSIEEDRLSAPTCSSKALVLQYHYYKNEAINIHSIIDGEIPYYFINKIDDINIIIGQQQLEYICQIINIFKNGNKNEKIEFIKKNNIQKSVNWCEKFKIPCNKFLDKTNIFYI